MKTSLNAIMETAIKNLLLKQMLNILNIYMIYSVIYDFYLKEWKLKYVISWYDKKAMLFT